MKNNTLTMAITVSVEVLRSHSDLVQSLCTMCSKSSNDIISYICISFNSISLT